MAKTKLFVSFDFDNDKQLKHAIVAQARQDGSPFEISDFSLKEAAKQSEWQRTARGAIARADKMVILLGPRTRFAPGVKKEVALAREVGTPCFQLIGYAHGSSAWAMPNGGRTYKWTWENLEKQLAPPWRSFAQRFLGA